MPTGVDRCEMAYARGLLATIPERLNFAAVHPIGVYGRLDRRAALRFLDLTEARWARYGFQSPWQRRRFISDILLTLRPRLHPISNRARSRIYLQASPNNLINPQLIGQILRRERARFVCLVHDLIPLEFPEYGRADGYRKHKARIATIARHASGIITNSKATMDALEPWLEDAGGKIHRAIAHLGTHVPTAIPPSSLSPERPYFVCIGTIEPRKNHLLLLNIWRRLSEERGAHAIPKLVLIGRRGWENEQIIDMLDRCAALKGCVEEHNGMSDMQVASLLAGARALLLPSFAEGYGMPVAEALALRVPVICSDLPALREAGGDAPEFLDPLDGLAWIRAIDDFTEAGERRECQLERLAHWSAPCWADHIQTVLTITAAVSRDEDGPNRDNEEQSAAKLDKFTAEI
jgi:glycosyltransferase involved in cell wall biosynthesis